MAIRYGTTFFALFLCRHSTSLNEKDRRWHHGANSWSVDDPTSPETSVARHRMGNPRSWLSDAGRGTVTCGKHFKRRTENNAMRGLLILFPSDHLVCRRKKKNDREVQLCSLPPELVRRSHPSLSRGSILILYCPEAAVVMSFWSAGKLNVFMTNATRNDPV